MQTLQVPIREELYLRFTMQYKGKVIKKILEIYPDEKTNKGAVDKFFQHYYTECGLSLKEIVDFILEGTTHSVLSIMARQYGIDKIATKGGNVYKYDCLFECDCGHKKAIKLLLKNKDKHKNLTLKCQRCIVGDLNHVG